MTKAVGRRACVIGFIAIISDSLNHMLPWTVKSSIDDLFPCPKTPLAVSHTNPSSASFLAPVQYAALVLMSEIFLSTSRTDRSNSPAIICFLSFGNKKYVSHKSPSIVPFDGT